MPAFADGQIDSWVAVVGAVVLFLTGGGLFKLLDWWSKEGERRRERDRKEQKEDTADERKQRKDAMDEAFLTIADLRADRELDRKERDLDRKKMDDLRSEIEKERVAHAVTDARLDECDRDRKELRSRLEALERKVNP
jgi:hypothetical protein